MAVSVTAGGGVSTAALLPGMLQAERTNPPINSKAENRNKVVPILPLESSSFEYNHISKIVFTQGVICSKARAGF
jgi:hypothetical protein